MACSWVHTRERNHRYNFYPQPTPGRVCYKVERLVCTSFFVHLKKAFDKVFREVVRWVMRKLGIEEWLVRVVKVMNA